MIFLAAIVVGIVAGWAGGGRLIALSEVRLHAWPAVLAGVLFNVLLPLLWPGLRAHLWAELARACLLYGAIGYLLWANRAMAGGAAVAAGMVCNAVATLRYGGRMPVWVAAAWRQLAARARLVAGGYVDHAPMWHPHLVGWLGDVFTVPPPLRPDVFSIGDVGIAIGLAMFLSAAMRPRRGSLTTGS